MPASRERPSISKEQLDAEVLAGCLKLQEMGIHPSVENLQKIAGIRRSSNPMAASRRRVAASGKIALRLVAYKGRETIARPDAAPPAEPKPKRKRRWPKPIGPLAHLIDAAMASEYDRKTWSIRV